MLMVEDVVRAEAVVAGAAGAVAELQIGELCVGAAADSALVAVALFPGLALLGFGGLLELVGRCLADGASLGRLCSLVNIAADFAYKAFFLCFLRLPLSLLTVPWGRPRFSHNFD